MQVMNKARDGISEEDRGIDLVSAAEAFTTLILGPNDPLTAQPCRRAPPLPCFSDR